MSESYSSLILGLHSLTVTSIGLTSKWLCGRQMTAPLSLCLKKARISTPKTLKPSVLAGSFRRAGFTVRTMAGGQGLCQLLVEYQFTKPNECESDGSKL